MSKKVLYGIIIGLACIGLVFGGTYLIYTGLSKGLNKLDENLLNSREQFEEAESTDPGKTSPSGNADQGRENSETGKNGKSGKNGSGSASQMTDEEKRQLFNEKLDAIMTYIDYFYYEEIDDDVIYDEMLHAALDALGDPYSTYYSPEEYDLLLESASGKYSGIGASISQNVETGQVLIVKPFIDSPAMKAGVLPGDEIRKIDGMSIEGLDLNEIVSYLKGEAGTKVTVTFLREGEEVEISIIRAEIVVQFVSSRMLNDDTGYIMVSEFEETTAEQFSNAVDELLEKGMKGLVIDLRDNPGGLVDSVVAMLDRIAPKGSLLVYTEDKYGQRESDYALSDESLDIPIVVIMNGNSASSSEIFAGAVQDLGLAKIVGTQSFGKGIVQAVIPIMQDLSGIKITSSRYYTPKGVCIHGVGITPDRVVELDEDLKKTLIEQRDHDNQIDAAVEMLKEMR